MSNPPGACPPTAGRSSSSSCRPRFCCSPSSSPCRWRRPAGTASTTGTATAGREKFIGLKNYGYLVGNATFTRSLINNGLIIVVSLLVQLPLALGVALMVAGRIAGAAWFRMIFFLPYVLADVAAGLIWRFMFDGGYGLVERDHRRARPRALYLLAEQDLGVQRGADRHPVEIFRLPHDAVRRGPAGHRQVAARGGGDGRRERVSALPPHHAAAARADDPAVDLLLGRRRAASFSTSSCR